MTAHASNAQHDQRGTTTLGLKQNRNGHTFRCVSDFRAGRVPPSDPLDCQ